MASSQPSPSAESPKRRRSPRERVLVWSGISLLLLVVLVEATSRYYYDLTLEKLEGAIGARKQGVENAGIPATEIDRYLQGFPFRSEETVELTVPASDGTNAPSHFRRLAFRWPSLFRTFQLAVTLNHLNRAVLVDSGSAKEIASETVPVNVVPPGPANGGPAVPSNTAPTVPSTSGAVAAMLAKLKPVLPPGGLSFVADQSVALAPDELEPATSLRERRFGSLGRELIRQSFLIAARDELGLDTLDASLSEFSLVTDAPKSFPFRLITKYSSHDSSTKEIKIIVHVMRDDLSGKSFKWSSSPIRISPTKGLELMAEQGDVLSREGFVTALKEAGFQQSSGSPATPISVPAEFEHRLDFVAQYAVLRQLHSQRRANGETVENLGGLVRTYANLGHLIDFHWSPMSKVFKARALIYAQRMLAKYGHTADTLAHRSYAWTLVGNHVLALQDAKAARSLQSEAVPEWLAMMEAFCEYNPTILQRAEGKLFELSRYLRMRLLDPVHERNEAVPAIEDVLKRNPACSRAIERMRETQSLGPVRMGAESVADEAWPAIYDRLAGIPNLPSNALKIAKQQHNRNPSRGLLAQFFTAAPANEHQSRIKFIAELRQAAATGDDRIEPSWTVLAEMISDLSFVQTERAITAEYQWLGLTLEQTTPTVKRLAPLVAGHRFGKFLSCYADDRPASLSGLTEVVNTTRSADYEIHCLPIANAAYQANPEYYKRLNEYIDTHWDKIDDDLLRAISSRYPIWEQEAWTLLVEVSPHRPLSIARVIHKSPDFTDEKAQEWERQYARSGYVLLELGRKYLALGRSTDAVRCLKQSVEVSPTHESYFELAAEYERREEIEASRETLEAALKIPSYGLEEGNTHNRLAGLLMYQGSWQEAEPHAKAAADTYSGWGLKAGARCAEGLKQWNNAEQYYQALSERYESSSGDNWYFACVRLGRGDVVASRKLAEKYWKAFVPPLRADQSWSLGLCQIIDGNLKNAIEAFTNPQNVHHHDPHQFLVAALLADKLGDAAKRDSLFGDLETRFGNYYAQVQLVNLFRNALRDPNHLQWNRYSFYELTDELGFNDVCSTYYCAGEFLANHGEEELSKEYLQCAATTYDVHRHTCLLANLALRARNIEVDESRVNRQPEDRLPSLTFLWRSYRAKTEKKYDEARADLNEALSLRPDFTAGLLARGKLSELEERFASALEDYEAVLRINPDSENAHAYLAALLSTCPDDKIRNGQKALEHANRCFELSITKTANEYWMLAAAHAECGNFPKAIEFQEQAVKRSPDNAEWAKQLVLYRAGKPYRLPSSTASAKP